MDTITIILFVAFVVMAAVSVLWIKRLSKKIEDLEYQKYLLVKKLQIQEGIIHANEDTIKRQSETLSLLLGQKDKEVTECTQK